MWKLVYTRQCKVRETVVTEETDNGTEEELDLSPGMVPHHNLGPVTGYDHDSGLPIVKRKPADQPASNPSAPGKKEEAAETKPAKPEPKPAASETKQSQGETPAEPQKGAPVRLKDGTTGKLSWFDKVSGIARIRRDADGKSVSVRKGAFQVQPHTQVSAHIRRINTK
jgi:hypothetical protein